MKGKTICAVAALALLAGAAGAETTLDEKARSFGVNLPPGYLPADALPDSNIFLPPPPAAGSAALALDQASADQAVALNGTPRFAQATLDAGIQFPDVTGLFSCAAGIAIGPDTTPKTDALLHKAMTDLGIGGYPTKDKYKHVRPFMVNEKPTCTPDHDAMLREDGSYPSGHSTIGYGWGLILAELLPARAAELVERGREFGDSRMVCNVHWLSDVQTGRYVAGAVVSRLHAAPEFRADMEAAAAELAASTAKPDPADCEREAAALAQDWPGNR